MKQNAGTTYFISTALSLLFISAKYTGCHFSNFIYALLTSSVQTKTQRKWAYCSMLLFLLYEKCESLRSLRTSFPFVPPLFTRNPNDRDNIFRNSFVHFDVCFFSSIGFQSESDIPKSSSQSFLKICEKSLLRVRNQRKVR